MPLITSQKIKASGDTMLKIDGSRAEFETKHSNMRSEVARERRQMGQQAVGNQ